MKVKNTKRTALMLRVCADARWGSWKIWGRLLEQPLERQPQAAIVPVRAEGPSVYRFNGTTGLGYAG